MAFMSLKRAQWIQSNRHYLVDVLLIYMLTAPFKIVGYMQFYIYSITLLCMECLFLAEIYIHIMVRIK